MAFNIEYIYTVIDKFSRPLNKLDKAVNRAAKAASRANKHFAALGRKAQDAADSFNTLGGAIGSAAIVAGMAKAVHQSIAVEDALQDLVRVGGLAAKELNMVDQSMESLSQELGKQKIGLLQQAFEGLKMGIPTTEINEFVRLAGRTGIAFDIMDQEAGRSLGSLRAKLGLSTQALGGLMDSVNFVADNFAASGSRMINIIERTSGTMKTLTFPPEVIAGLAGFADQIETSSELAASGLNQIFARMQRNPKLVKELMQDPVAALTRQFEKFNKIDPAKRFSVIEKTFGLEAARFMSKAISNIDLFDKTMKAAASQKALGSMMRELENRSGRTSTLFKIMGTIGSNVLEDIGNALKPAIRMFAKFSIIVGDALKRFIERNPTLVQFGAILASIVAIAGVAGIALSGLALAAGLVSGPILAIAAGIALAIAAVTRWVATNNPLIASLGRIWDGITNALVPLGELFGITGEGLSFLDSMVALLDAIGVAISILLTPIELLARSFQGLVETGIALVNLDFSAAMNAITSMFSDSGNILGGKINEVSSFVSGSDDNANAVATRRQQTANANVNISGSIGVEASGGAEIKRAEITANNGNNLSFMGS